MSKLYIPTKRPKKVSLKVDVPQETLERFNLYIEYLVHLLGNDAEARASVDPGDIVSRSLKPWLESDEFLQWKASRTVTKMLRTG